MIQAEFELKTSRPLLAADTEQLLRRHGNIGVTS